ASFSSRSQVGAWLARIVLIVFCKAVTGFLGWLVFAIQHDTRSWLINPRFNHLDWAFYVAVFSSLLNLAAAVLFAIETRNAQLKRQRFTNLVYNMHPRFI